KQLYNAISLTVRDSIMEKWAISIEDMENNKQKQLYYLSLEFLIGRAPGNNIINLLKSDVYREVCESLDVTLDEIIELENDAGLGNGGLGRLEACFLDSPRISSDRHPLPSGNTISRARFQIRLPGRV
ncbi:MAG: glycogen/starch/alpha-glucan phosphorylase, partial [Clostridiales bacterium]|nr:glycogen/starch/alpha-glucan phosphorylase [Clostridiales bacterium]